MAGTYIDEYLCDANRNKLRKIINSTPMKDRSEINKYVRIYAQWARYANVLLRFAFHHLRNLQY